MADNTTVLAAPQIQQNMIDGGKKFTDMLTNDGTLKTFLMVMGGLVLVVAVALLLFRKFWPNSSIGQKVQGNAIIWILCAAALGLIFIAPNVFVPFLLGLLGWVVQRVLDFGGSLFGL